MLLTGLEVASPPHVGRLVPGKISASMMPVQNARWMLTLYITAFRAPLESKPVARFTNHTNALIILLVHSILHRARCQIALKHVRCVLTASGEDS